MNEQKPIDMVLHCPKCGLQHIDKDNYEEIRIRAAELGIDREGDRAYCDWLDENEWTNPPHKSHLCRKEDGGCGHIWRPADVPTNGVASVQPGRNDSPIAKGARGPSTTDHEAQRPAFEDAIWTYYQTLKANGWAAPEEGDTSSREALFWRTPAGKYGVQQIEAAWWGWKLKAVREAMLLDWLESWARDTTRVTFGVEDEAPHRFFVTSDSDPVYWAADLRSALRKAAGPAARAFCNF